MKINIKSIEDAIVVAQEIKDFIYDRRESNYPVVCIPGKSKVEDLEKVLNFLNYNRPDFCLYSAIPAFLIDNLEIPNFSVTTLNDITIMNDDGVMLPFLLIKVPEHSQFYSNPKTRTRIIKKQNRKHRRR